MNFITGVSGFLGSYLAKKLIDNGEQVISIKRPSTRMDLLGDYVHKITWYEADLLDIPALEIAMKDAQYVYHCAAKISFDSNERSYMYKVHVEGTANIVNLAILYKVKKMIHVSSVSALPAPKHDELINEQSEWSSNPYPAHYGKSKFMAEREAYRAMAEGVNTIIVNPSTIIGAGFWNEGTGTFFTNMYKGYPFYTEGIVGFVDVRDVAECMIQLMKSTIINDKFIINAENYTFKKMFSSIALNLNKKAPSYRVIGLLGSIAILSDSIQCLFTGKNRLVTKETLVLANLKSNYDNAKIKKALGYTFRPMEQTIKETAIAFLSAIKNHQSHSTFDTY